MKLDDAIDYYHSLLNDEQAANLDGILREGAVSRRLAFGERQVCTVLRPNLLTHEQYAYIQAEVTILLSAFRKLYIALLEQPAMRDELMLTDGEKVLIEIEPGFAVPTPSTRLDSFYTDAGLRFVEYNAESPAGMAYEDGMAEMFEQMPIWQAFTQRYHAEHLPTRQPLLETLIQTYNEWARNTGRQGVQTPTIAIIDWKGLPTQNEFEMLEEYFNQNGIPSFISEPDALEYSNGKLTANGRPFDLLYKRMLTSEFLITYGVDAALQHPIVQALRDGAVCMTNSFRAKLLHKKAIFALITDPNYAYLFNVEEQRAIHEHIPWTRHVRDGLSTDSAGNEVELLAYIRANPHNLVLKPNDEYGGKGVIIGWEAEAGAWESALHEAIDCDYLVQERVPVQKQNFPSYSDGLVFAERLIDLDPYIFNGDHVSGILTRLSASSLLNVTAGGGSVVPTFLVSERT